MEKIIINPENYKEQYIYNLNQCFNDWGGDKEYNWVFNRIVGKKPSDIMIIKNENNEVIAGSGITYRKLKIDNQKVIDIGIMTGSWTLPEARGRGCFSKMIEISKNICKQNTVPFLTAFVMESNPSYRRLKHAGSHLISTYHFISKEVPYSNEYDISIVKSKSQAGVEIYDIFKKEQKDYFCFDYTYEDFSQQYINRIKNTELLRIGNDYAIIEESENIIKVLLISYYDKKKYEDNIKALTNWGLQTKSKKLLLFTTKKDIVEILNNQEFENLSSYFTILSTSGKVVKDIELFETININLGDKI